ncbi:MAG: hypothetical protein E6R03_14825 [Hyphomicrobiaceae bacterium]|nr:MAG: hypothetical protein E6R03_14825 [Hyphomicrobiaceae bacterium]
MSKLIIAHANCTDGFTAAWAAYQPGDEVIYASYGQEPPDVAGKDVVILDFSYRRDKLIAMHEAANSLLVLDHHESAMYDLEGLSFAKFDMGRSGAMMAWHHYHPGETSVLVDFVQDRDLYTNALYCTRQVNAFLRWQDKSFERWDELHSMLLTPSGVQAVAADGQAYETLIKQLVNEASKSPGYAMVPHYEDGKPAITIGVVNNGPAVGSDLAANLLIKYQDFDAAAIWYQASDGSYRFSLRARRGGINVAKLAERWGGGGHAGASGFITQQWPLTVFPYPPEKKA